MTAKRRRVINVIVALTLLSQLVLLPSSSVRAAANLTIKPISWNIIGLDGNKVTSGPDTFMVGARVCNTGDVAASNVIANLVWDSDNAYINLSGAQTLSSASLAAGNCTDFYFNGVITRTTLAFKTTRRFHITAMADGLTAVSTPTPRELYIEQLVSRNRNSVLGITGPTSVVVGNTYQYTVTASTAPGGYEQLETFVNFPNVMFQLVSVASTYTTPSGSANDTIYADACGWDNNVTSGTYRSIPSPT